MPASATRGTQTIDRAVAVMKALAARSATGWRLSDLATHCGLDRATTHRILACLTRHRLARRRAANRRYAPGPLLYELGLAFPALAEFQAASRPILARVARQLKGAALLYLKSDEDFVCVARADAARVRGLSVEVGTRRPLALSAPGIAILLALPADEGERVLAANMVAVRRFGEVRVRSVEEAIRRSRRAGLGLNLGDIVPGLWSFGVPMFDRAGRPFAALGATGHAENYSAERMPEIAKLLRAEARRLEGECAALIPAIAG
jgi:DNA-binding IclR family transcriptional regulator